MTMYKPTLRVRRMAIYKREHVVFDESFHEGLNIIRGENSSGKSTIMDFIFFGLGGNLTTWRAAAAQCERVILGVELNGVPITLSRYVEPQPLRPMLIYWGPFEDAVQSDLRRWEIYQFARREKESFSQVLFRLLGYPEARGEGSSNITIHQLLRLLYSDQLSPVEDLFRFEQWDNGLIREAVGAFLCGSYDPHIYDAQLELRKLEKEYDEVSGKLDGIFKAFSHSREGLTLSWIAAEQKSILDQKIQREAELQKRKDGLRDATSAVTDQRVALTSLKEKIARTEAEISKLNGELEAVTYELQDSKQFVEDIRQNLVALDQSETVRSALGDVVFEHCPSCLSPLKTAPPDSCSVCKSPLDRERSLANLARMRRDLEAQIRESERLNEQREDTQKRLRQALFELTQQNEKSISEYRSLADSLSHPTDQAIEMLAKEIGYLERRLDELVELSKVALTVEQLSAKKAELLARKSSLSDEVGARLAAQERRKLSAYTQVAELTKYFLKADLPREEAFSKAVSVQFVFEKNMISVDGSRMFAASSMVYLKNSFHLALFTASLRDPEFRVPRFMMFDNVEDKGMEPERSQNFQRIAAEVCNNSSVDCQIIMTTSMIADELNEAPYTVGEYYTHENRTLRQITV